MTLEIVNKIFEGEFTVGNILLGMYYQCRALTRYNTDELKFKYLNYIIENKNNIVEFFFKSSKLKSKYDLDAHIGGDEIDRIFNEFESQYGIDK